MANILVIDDEAVVREPIAASLRAHGHQVRCAADGSDAMAQVRAQLPEIILLDIRMPLRDGVSVLRDLRSSPSTLGIPVLLMSNTTDKAVILEAAKLGVQSYILKSTFSLTELLDRIDRIAGVAKTPNRPQTSTVDQNLQPTARRSSPPETQSERKEVLPLAAVPKGLPSQSPPLPKLLTREQTLERLDLVVGGKAPAGVVAQLISVANSSSADLADVVQVIGSDPVLASRVIQLANSASTGGRVRVRNVEDAARNLGVRGIQNMAISIGIFGAFPPDEQDGFNSIRCWQHSYAVAELLNLLMHSRNSEQESLNHLIGLCHDLGEILLRQYFVHEHEQILQFAIAHGQPLQEVESAALGVRHPELISRLLTRLGLPSPVVQAIREFHERQIRGQAAGISVAAFGLSLANLAAHGLLLAPSPREMVRPVTRTEWRQLGVNHPLPTIDPAITRDAMVTSTNILARLPAKDEQRLLVPPIPRVSRRICYVRPESFVEFDPLAFALSLSCNLEISATIPEPSHVQEIDALVLVGLRAGIPPIIPDELVRFAAGACRVDMPILALVAQENSQELKGCLQLRSFPISLEDIGAWLHKVPSRQH